MRYKIYLNSKNYKEFKDTKILFTTKSKTREKSKNKELFKDIKTILKIKKEQTFLEFVPRGY